jgi:uncharacterized damage-inducible protein DinB
MGQLKNSIWIFLMNTFERSFSMTSEPVSLASLWDGWDGYHTSIVHAVQPLTRDQLVWRPGPNLRSVGEVAAHIAFGRIEWFSRMPAPGSLELAQESTVLGGERMVSENQEGILSWLDRSWKMVANTLQAWTVDDLSRSYHHAYQGQVYKVSYQWTIWRILTHDIHHGGELALLLGMQGIAVPELGDLFGHLTMPPVVGPSLAE